MSQVAPYFTVERPVHASPPPLHMRAANLAGFARLSSMLGRDPRGVLEQHDIDPLAASDPDCHIKCKSFVTLLEHCSELFDDNLFGLTLARLQKPSIYGAVATVCQAAPTMRDAVASFMSYIPVIHSPESHMEFVEGREICELRWRVRPDFGASDQISFQALTLNLRLFQAIGGPGLKMSYVNLGGNLRQRELDALEDQLGCRVRTKSSQHVIAFPADALDRPSDMADPLVFNLVGGYLNTVRDRTTGTFTERVEQYVRSSLPSGRCSIENCARKLDVSVRYIQKKLGRAGTSFSDILERERIDLAKAYLGHEGMTLDRIAEMLSYSDQTSFGRAFKRWTGQSPRRFMDGGPHQPN